MTVRICFDVESYMTHPGYITYFWNPDSGFSTPTKNNSAKRYLVEVEVPDQVDIKLEGEIKEIEA
jgi:hypothetical protein